MPFYTDGKIYASNIETLLEAESEPQAAKIKLTKKTTKKTKKAKKELNDGPVE
jgi:hypothetical protein